MTKVIEKRIVFVYECDVCGEISEDLNGWATLTEEGKEKHNCPDCKIEIGKV